MKSLVCISKVPDTTARIAFTNDNTIFDTSGVQHIMNPYDEWYALVKALEIREAHGGTVTLIHVGEPANESIIRKGLAIGADDAIRINKEALNAEDVATQIAAVAKDGNYDLIFTGKETIEYNNAQVGSMLAGLLDLPFISFATALDIDGRSATLVREGTSGDEKIALELPLVLSASKGLAEQRIPNMRGIMMAKRKPLEVKEPVISGEKTRIVRFDLPEERSNCVLVDPEDMEELVRLLHEEAKVI